MQKAVTYGKKGKDWEVIVPPDVPFSQQRKEFRENKAIATEKGYDEIYLISFNSGTVKRKTNLQKPIREAEEAKKAAEAEVDDDFDDLLGDSSSEKAATKKAVKKTATKKVAAKK